MRNRKVGSHELNMESSRSHSIVTVHCNMPAGEDLDSCARYGKVPFSICLFSPYVHKMCALVLFFPCLFPHSCIFTLFVRSGLQCSASCGGHTYATHQQTKL